MVFSKAPKATFFFLAVPSKPWSSTSWFFQSSQSCCILLHGFFQSFQSSQSCVIFILGFFFPKTPWLWFFFFLAKTSKSWFFPKFLKSSFSSWPYLQSHGLFLFGFFQSSQSCCLHPSFSQSSMIVVILCYFWLLVSMPTVLFNSLIICNSKIFKLSLPPHVFYSNN